MNDELFLFPFCWKPRIDLGLLWRWLWSPKTWRRRKSQMAMGHWVPQHGWFTMWGFLQMVDPPNPMGNPMGFNMFQSWKIVEFYALRKLRSTYMDIHGHTWTGICGVLGLHFHWYPPFSYNIYNIRTERGLQEILILYHISTCSRTNTLGPPTWLWKIPQVVLQWDFWISR